MFENLFNQDTGGSPIDVLNTLLDPENITMKTDLNIGQVKILTRQYYFQLRKSGLDPWECNKKAMKYYMQLMCSIKRKSRTETIEGIKEMKEALLQTQLAMTGLMPQRK